jgi:hypothetical protein
LRGGQEGVEGVRERMGEDIGEAMSRGTKPALTAGPYHEGRGQGTSADSLAGGP